jgi:hypothetical protein
MKFRDMHTEEKILRVFNEIILWCLFGLIIFWSCRLMFWIFDIIIEKFNLLGGAPC